nr:hypothetical protein [uncultured Rhodopila sp.]
MAYGNFAGTSDLQSRAVAGGNLTGGAPSDIHPASAAASSFSGLIVYGSATEGGIPTPTMASA